MAPLDSVLDRSLCQGGAETMGEAEHGVGGDRRQSEGWRDKEAWVRNDEDPTYRSGRDGGGTSENYSGDRLQDLMLNFMLSLRGTMMVHVLAWVPE